MYLVPCYKLLICQILLVAWVMLAEMPLLLFKDLKIIVFHFKFV